jgi:hypothetical protein
VPAGDTTLTDPATDPTTGPAPPPIPRKTREDLIAERRARKDARTAKARAKERAKYQAWLEKEKQRAERANKPRPWLLRWLPRRRLAPVYDVAGPRVRFGVLWFLANMAGLAVGLELMAPLYIVTAGTAGLQAASAWRRREVRAHTVVAGVGAGLIALGAAVSIGFMGVAILVVVGVAYYVALIDLEGGNPVNQASYTVQCALLPGLAAAGVLLTLRYDLIAAAGLVLLVSAYDSGDFLIGSESRRRWEGPAMGAIAVMVMTFALSTLRLPPFVLPQSLYLGALAALLCPIGQLVASAVLPDAAVRAPAVRRLDSSMILAPVWPVAIGVLDILIG